MRSYTAENSPPLSCYPIPPLDADGQLITFMGQGGWCARLLVCVCAHRAGGPGNFEEDLSGLRERKAGVFGGSSFS